MIDPSIKALLETPLDGDNVERINKPWLPMGKRPAPKPQKPEYHVDEMPKLSAKEARQRAFDAKDKRLGALLTYYAGTDVPLDRIEQHTGLDAEAVRRAMKQRGRNA